MKTIGVLGGVGPQATMDFEGRLHRVAQRLVPPDMNSGYPPMVVWYHRRPPFVMTDAGVPALPFQADPGLLEAARWLGARADFLVMAANSPHLVKDELERAAGRRFLSIIDVTLEEVRRRRWRRVGLLGFGEPLVYMGPLGACSLAHETIAGELRAALDAAIRKVMEGRDDAAAAAAARDAIASLRGRATDGIILGCTEIPLLLRERAEEPDLLNPAQLLAEAAVKYAVS